MSQSSPNSEQPENSQSRIEQSPSGNLLGGQQAAIGNNNTQVQDNSTTYINIPCSFYNELRDEDLEPLTITGKILSYFGVFIVLLLTLVFWFFFGLFISFPFPFDQALELLQSCFRGKVTSRVNRLQKQLQLRDVDSLAISELNEVDFEARLYLKILECLGSNKVGNHERLAKTIEALRQKRVMLQDEIQPRQPKKYQNVAKAQDFFESFILNQSEEDFMQIEKILVEVTSSIKNSYPSEAIVKDTLDKLSSEVSQKADKINANRLGILYRIEDLLREVNAKEPSSFEESKLQSLNRKNIAKLKEERNLLSSKINQLSEEKEKLQKMLAEYSDEASRLNRLTFKREADLLELEKRISRYIEINQGQEEEINDLTSVLQQEREELINLQNQKLDLEKEVAQLHQSLKQKQVDIDRLVNQVDQYSTIRMLKGDYIGNLSDPKAKYHFDRKCNHWKMLVGEYVLNLDGSREIVSSKTPNLFLGKLEECDRCAGRKSS